MLQTQRNLNGLKRTSYDQYISDMFILAKHAKKMLTVQSVQCHMVADCTGCTTVQIDVAGYMDADCGHVQVDQSECDMCHHCKGDTWHVHMTNIAGLYSRTTRGRYSGM
jgi:hypothetical protein